MKLRSIFFLIIISLNNYVQAEDLYLSLNLVEMEKSKDSNEVSYQIDIRDNNVNYQIRKTGRVVKNEDNLEKLIVLNEKKYSQLIDILDDPVFKQDINELKPMDMLGNAIHLELIVEKKGKKVHFQLAGMTRIMRTRAANIDNINLYKKVHSIIMLVLDGKSGQHK